MFWQFLHRFMVLSGMRIFVENIFLTENVQPRNYCKFVEKAYVLFRLCPFKLRNKKYTLKQVIFFFK